MNNVKIINHLTIDKSDKSKTYWIDGTISYNGVLLQVTGGTSAINGNAKLIFKTELGSRIILSDSALSETIPVIFKEILNQEQKGLV